ncbi:hypothetical protein [Streptomyces sp. NPDC001348]
MSGAAGEVREPAAVVAPGERGALRIADKVVAKIAAQAAREAVGPLPGPAAPPRTGVVVRHDIVRVRVDLELGYPSDIPARCRAVRHRVTERVTALAGMAVREVAVRVERLHPTHPGGTAGGRTR